VDGGELGGRANEQTSKHHSAWEGVRTSRQASTTARGRARAQIGPRRARAAGSLEDVSRAAGGSVAASADDEAASELGGDDEETALEGVVG
jgi:predicted amidohydrolase